MSNKASFLGIYMISILAFSVFSCSPNQAQNQSVAVDEFEKS